MEQYIKKSALVAEIKRILSAFENSDAPVDRLRASTLIGLLSFIDTLEVKDMSMPALDNGNMPVERWKAACKAASCQANYRKSKGLTETCDDYFVDGVQWADEHPKKIKEPDLDKEIDDIFQKYKNGYNGFLICKKSDFSFIAKYFFELGLKVQKG